MRASGGLLAVFAHPDDESLSAGGLLARTSADGAPVSVVTCTWAVGSHRAPELADALAHLGAGAPRLLALAPWQRDPAEKAKGTSSTVGASMRWFVERSVRATTTTGVPYFDVEWLRPDRSWSRSRAEALSFDHDPAARPEALSLVNRLREQALVEADPAKGEVNLFLRPADTSVETENLPPPSIRDYGHHWWPPSG